MKWRKPLVRASILAVALIIFYEVVPLPFFPLTGAWRYPGVISTFKNPWKLQFPDEIPPEAKHVHFHYRRPCLQGYPAIMLSFELPEREFLQLKRSIEEAHQPLTPEDLRRVHSSVNKMGSSEFTSYLLSPSLESAKKNWNHPLNSGVSFSKAGFRVTYWLN